VGRYFSLVSALPSVLLVFYVFFLVSSGSWSGRPDWREAVSDITRLGVRGSLALIGVSVGVALVLHPLQFALVQILEGYWGVSRVAEHARSVRMKHHWERLTALSVQKSRNEDELLARGEGYEDEDIRARMRLVSRIAESARVLQGQPSEPDLVMPTRLGIILRYYETTAGSPFGLKAIQVMPYLARVAKPQDMAYVSDQRSQMDLAVRMSVTAMLACLATLVMLWRGGLWLLIALLPYAVAYLSYRGAVVAAGHYGSAVGVVIALNRFALYKRLRLPIPATAGAERDAAGSLSGLMDFSDEFETPYQDPPPAGGT
jgi:hypothetical protein